MKKEVKSAKDIKLVQIFNQLAEIDSYLAIEHGIYLFDETEKNLTIELNE